jgi:hypothetical protein
VTVIAGHVTLSEYERLPVHPLLSVAVTVNVDDPAALGVPVSAPPDASDTPAGNVPEVTAKL